MNKPLAFVAAAFGSLTFATAFGQSAPDSLSNEIAAGAAAARVNSSTSRDEVTHSLRGARQRAPDSMAGEAAAGASSERSSSTMTREQVQAEMRRAQQQPHSQMDTERAAWG
jgi:hypothetical protein